MSKMAILQVNDVSKQFGTVTAIRSISLTVGQGEIVGFVGANGAGKTTTIGVILGFIRPSSGEVHLFGKKLLLTNAHRAHERIGYAAGDMRLPARLTGKQFLNFVLHQNSKTNYQEFLDDLCRRFKPQLEKKIGELSRGNKQKIALIAAFMTKPELIILDEPTSGLDPVMQEVFLRLVQETAAEGRTVFMSSHYLNEIADVCSRVILMRNGRIIEDIFTKELLEKSGKQIRVVTSHKATRPPKQATGVMVEQDGAVIVMSFSYKGSMVDLQTWLSSVKLLQDVEISEYNLESVFKEMYDDEGLST
jgi:ABC-2 type transport system ATP-binding protein